MRRRGNANISPGDFNDVASIQRNGPTISRAIVARRKYNPMRLMTCRVDLLAIEHPLLLKALKRSDKVDDKDEKSCGRKHRQCDVQESTPGWSSIDSCCLIVLFG